MTTDLSQSSSHSRLRQATAYAVLFAVMLVAFFLMVWDIDTTTINIRMHETGSLEAARETHAATIMREQPAWTTVEGQNVEQRKRLRWLGKAIVRNAISVVVPGGLSTDQRNALIIHAYQLLHGFFLAGAMVLALAAYARRMGEDRPNLVAALMFFALIVYVLRTADWEENYTTIELFAIAGVMYATVSRNIGAFLCFAALAVTIRESAIVIGVVYALIDWRGLARAAIVVAAPVAIFIAVNFGTLIDPALYSASVITTFGSPRPSLLDFWNHPIKQWAAFLVQQALFYAPLLLLLSKRFRCRDELPLLLCAALYFTVITVGTYLGNMFPHILLVPFLVPVYVRLLSSVTSTTQTVWREGPA